MTGRARTGWARTGWAGTGWAVLWRGVRYRAGRSAVVALLAAVAVAAAVLAPGFARAAQQSVLTDGLAAAPPPAAGLTVTATGAAAGNAAGSPAAHQSAGDARAVVDAALAEPLAGALAAPVAGVDVDTLTTMGGHRLATRLAWRGGVCDQLEITGDCPIDAGQVLVSERTAGEYGLAVGDPVTTGTGVTAVIAGVYVPRDPTAPYWGRTVYFAHGGFDPDSGAPRVDAVFAGAESDVTAGDGPVSNGSAVRLGLTYPLRPDAVRLDQVGRIRDQLREVEAAAGSAGLSVVTELPAILDGVAADQEAIGRVAPVVAVPLVLLAAFVLYLLVAALTEERGREIALAKLRGFPAGRAARFGLGEVLALIVAATPVGVLLGLAAVEVAARLALAGGTHAEPRRQLALAAGLALVVAVGAALLAGRATLRRGVLDLLRRVPARTRWHAGVAEGIVVALAAASLVAAIRDRAAPLAMLAPALLAVVAGIVAARSVRLWARFRAGRPGRASRRPVAGLLAAAQLSRAPGGQRVIAVTTVAVALLAFGVTAWDASAQARRGYAVDTVGAAQVYTVAAEHPAALLAAVRRASPEGSAMAVVRTRQQYGGRRVELLAVDTPRLAGVVEWRGTDAGAFVADLRPREPVPVELAGRVEVTARVTGLGDEPVRISVLVAAPGEPPRSVALGTLAAGTGDYAARLPGWCVDGCRLLGLGLRRGGAAGPFTANVEVRAIRTGGDRVDLPARLDDLFMVADGDDGNDVVAEYADTVPELPAVLAGPAPAEDPDAGRFPFFGLAERPEPFTVVDRVARLPRAGGQGLMFDLEYAVHSAERSVALADSSGLGYEVWASPDAPPDLPRRLASEGVPVLDRVSIAATEDQLGRRAPALGLWLYLLAAFAALALALGVVAVSTRVGVEARLADLAALRACGVGSGTLRRALLRERAALVGVPLLSGVAVGLAAAALMLPGIPLVAAGETGSVPAYRAGMAPVAAGIVTAAGLVLVFWRDRAWRASR